MDLPGIAIIKHEGLTMENFWNSIAKKYPLAYDRFSKWIDEYKKVYDWIICSIVTVTTRMSMARTL